MKRLDYFLIGIVAAVGCAILVSCMTTTRVAVAPATIEGAHYVGNDRCASCHVQKGKSFARTSHSRLVLREGGEKGVTFGCEACHGAGSKHVDVAGVGGQFILNPRNDAEACYKCHADIHALNNLQYHHPIREGKMSCISCHDPHGEDIQKPKGLLMASGNDRCAQCHREQARPRVFEHEALREGCTTCHNPHGSINDKMLVARDNNLCLKCHVQTASGSNVYIGKSNHTTRLQQGTCWSAGCHTGIHGSNINAHLRY